MVALVVTSILLLLALAAPGQTIKGMSVKGMGVGNPTVGAAAPGFIPSTTYAAQTGSQTVIADTRTVYPDTRAGVLTPDYELGSTNVSQENIKNLLYSGTTTKVYAEFMSWFRDDGTCALGLGGEGGWSVLRWATGGHYCVGYNSNDAARIHAQVNDMILRGFDGVMVTYEGVYRNGTTTYTTSDATVQLLKADLEARCSGSCPFGFAIMYDGSAFQYSDGYAGAPHTSQCCSIASGPDEDAFIAKMRDDVCYLNKNYFGSPAYLKVGGKPMMQPFISEGGRTATSSPSWADAWIILNTFTQDLAANCPATFGAAYTGAADNGDVAWYFDGSFTHDGLTNSSTVGPVYGAFTWENGVNDTYGVAGQTSNNASSISSVDSYYTAAKTHPLAQNFGAIWPGFNDKLADWAPNPPGCAAGSDCTTAGRMADAACGTTWLNSIARVNAAYNSGTQLPYLGVVTWNDYDEGTGIETGIDNCYSITSPAVVGSNFTWTMTASRAAASITTIDHFTLYLADGGGNMQVLQDGISKSAASVAIPGTVPAGTWSLYLKMVGVNSIRNKPSAAVTYIK
jgi:hypothetical protein